MHEFEKMENLGEKFFEMLDLYQEGLKEGQELPLLEGKLFEALYKAHFKKVDSIIYLKYRLPVCYREEIGSDAFMAMQKGLGQLRARSTESLNCWVYAIVSHELARWFEKTRRERKMRKKLRDRLQEEEARDRKRDHLEDARSWLRENFLQYNWVGLSELEREIVMDHYIYGKAYSVIAEEQAITTGNARKISCEARKKLYEAYYQQLDKARRAVLVTCMRKYKTP